MNYGFSHLTYIGSKLLVLFFMFCVARLKFSTKSRHLASRRRCWHRNQGVVTICGKLRNRMQLGCGDPQKLIILYCEDFDNL